MFAQIAEASDVKVSPPLPKSPDVAVACVSPAMPLTPVSAANPPLVEVDAANKPETIVGVTFIPPISKMPVPVACGKLVYWPLMYSPVPSAPGKEYVVPDTTTLESGDSVCPAMTYSEMLLDENATPFNVIGEPGAAVGKGDETPFM